MKDKLEWVIPAVGNESLVSISGRFDPELYGNSRVLPSGRFRMVLFARMMHSPLF